MLFVKNGMVGDTCEHSVGYFTYKVHDKAKKKNRALLCIPKTKLKLVTQDFSPLVLKFPFRSECFSDFTNRVKLHLLVYDLVFK